MTAARLRQGRARELPELADELAAWAASLPARSCRAASTVPPHRRPRAASGADLGPSARGAREGRLPSGRTTCRARSIVKSQRERIVDATAAIVAEKGLAGLTIPEIARRANVSHQTFYEIYATKHDAFLGAQKVGMHQALRVTVEAYDSARPRTGRAAVAAGLRALIDYLVSEPAHAHLTLVDTFGASPEAIEIREQRAATSSRAYLRPGYELAPTRRRGAGRSPPRRSPAACGRCCTTTSSSSACRSCTTRRRSSSTSR